uniref:Uncharacterized protein n=1 Tax=Knipowitschia caucasica TaxID=637954 RepID=A0AAV2LNA1_KNICA
MAEVKLEQTELCVEPLHLKEEPELCLKQETELCLKQEPWLCVKPEEFPFHIVTVKTEDDDDDEEASYRLPSEEGEKHMDGSDDNASPLLSLWERV